MTSTNGYNGFETESNSLGVREALSQAFLPKPFWVFWAVVLGTCVYYLVQEPAAAAMRYTGHRVAHMAGSCDACTYETQYQEKYIERVELEISVARYQADAQLSFDLAEKSNSHAACRYVVRLYESVIHKAEQLDQLFSDELEYADNFIKAHDSSSFLPSRMDKLYKKMGDQMQLAELRMQENRDALDEARIRLDTMHRRLRYLQ